MTLLAPDDAKPLAAQGSGRRTNPLRSVPMVAASGRGGAQATVDAAPARRIALDPATARQAAQLPGFAPLLDELEIAGWSSHRRRLSGNFHDWLLLDGRQMLVAAGQAVGADPLDPAEAALVAQATWATLRAHALHVRDAGLLLSLAARSLWPLPGAAVQACVAVALVDTAEGHASVAMAGDGLAWRIRAAALEQVAFQQPMLGATTDFAYLAQTVQLSLRERLLLVADDGQRRPAKLPAAIAASFARLDAESHRRMLASDAVALVRRHFNGDDEARSPASLIAIRRR